MGPGPAAASGDVPHLELAEMLDHLLRAEEDHRRALLHGPQLPAGHEPTLETVFSVIRGAFSRYGTWISGPQLAGTTGVKIALYRKGHGACLAIDEQTTSADITAFIAALRSGDQHLLVCAELIGLLLALSLQWTAAGFSPPAVLLSLHANAPRILALGQAALAPPDS